MKKKHFEWRACTYKRTATVGIGGRDEASITKKAIQKKWQVYDPTGVEIMKTDPS